MSVASSRKPVRWLSLAALVVSCNVASAGDLKRYGKFGLDLDARDLSVRPGDNFAMYSWGTWYRKAVIPPSERETGAYPDLIHLADLRTRAIIEESVKHPASSETGKIGDLYASYMDEARIEAVGDAPLLRDISAIRQIADKSAMAKFMGTSVGSPFRAGFFVADVGPDSGDPTRNVIILRQSGLGLPARDYYLDPQFNDKKAAYRDYVVRTLKLAGWANADQSADAVLKLEDRIAAASWSSAEQRDTVKTYNPMTPTELEMLAPEFPWTAFFNGAGIPPVLRVVVAEKSAFPQIAAIFSDTPLATLKAWEAFQLTDHASPDLPSRFADNRFEFRGRILQGRASAPARWSQAVQIFDTNLSDAVGREYVRRYFPASSKRAVETIASNEKRAMKLRIERIGWMSPSTKLAALRKLAKFEIMVGYPDRWRDYSGLRIARDDLYGNLERSAAFEWAHKLSELVKPVDRRAWEMSPQTPDAYTTYERLGLVFGAGYLEPPLFDPSADMAVNYGAIGGVIGHEMTHQFDDQGSGYDWTGKQRNWWTPGDAARFKSKSQRLARQFNAYEILPGLHVNGEQTLGENIADLGGLLVTLDAYHLALHGRPAPVIAGLTGDQRLFLAWAQMWRKKTREDLIRLRAVSDVHAPERFRAIGPTRNIDAWYRAFNVEPADRYYVAPSDRVRIW